MTINNLAKTVKKQKYTKWQPMIHKWKFNMQNKYVKPIQQKLNAL